MRTQSNQHTNSLLKSLASLLWNKREVRTFRALVTLFLDTELRTTLQNITGISASTASRFLSCEHAPDAVFWEALNAWQFAQFAQLPRRGRRGDVLLKLDLTCIEKTGKRIPFARVFNKVFGIQLVVLHACVNGLSFPLGYRIYLGKGKPTVVALALELLAEFPASRFSARTVVLADSGFGSGEFITGAQSLGFTRLLVGLKCNRRLNDGAGWAHLLSGVNRFTSMIFITYRSTLVGVMSNVRAERNASTSPLPLLRVVPTSLDATANVGLLSPSSSPLSMTSA